MTTASRLIFTQLRSEEMTQQEFNTMRGVTNKSRVDSTLYATAGSGKGKAGGAAAVGGATAVAADDVLLGTQASTSADAGAVAGDVDGKKQPGRSAAAETMYYRVTCKVGHGRVLWASGRRRIPTTCGCHFVIVCFNGTACVA